MSPLENAIKGLYGAFGATPKPHHIDGCPCCMARKQIGVLLGKSVRLITPQEMGPYAASAFLTVGDVADYLYFLPRILEITATDSSWWPTPEVTAIAIRSANLDSWAHTQRTALYDYLKAVVSNAIQPSHYHELDGWMCAIGRMGFDVRPFLDEIAKCPEAVLDYFETNAASLPRNKLTNAFWEQPCPAHDAIVDWFFSPEIARIPFEAYGCVLIRSS
jgi:hypothetical protein